MYPCIYEYINTYRPRVTTLAPSRLLLPYRQQHYQYENKQRSKKHESQPKTTITDKGKRKKHARKPLPLCEVKVWKSSKVFEKSQRRSAASMSERTDKMKKREQNPEHEKTTGTTASPENQARMHGWMSSGTPTHNSERRHDRGNQSMLVRPNLRDRVPPCTHNTILPAPTATQPSPQPSLHSRVSVCQDNGGHPARDEHAGNTHADESKASAENKWHDFSLQEPATTATPTTRWFHGGIIRQPRTELEREQTEQSTLPSKGFSYHV
jgi:hypothetical protein